MTGTARTPPAMRPGRGALAGMRLGQGRLGQAAALGLALLVAGCATAPPAVEGTRGVFWGLLDGALAPISFVISLFSDTVAVYGVPNSGGWYDFGFLLGLTCWAGGGAASKKRTR